MAMFSFLLSVIVALFAVLIAVLNLEIPVVNEFLVRRAFERFQTGVFCVNFLEDNIMWKVGDLSGPDRNKCDNTMTIVNKAEFLIGILHGSIGLGESYYLGHWKADKNEGEDQDLGDLVTHLFYNFKVHYSWLSAYLRYLRIYDWQEYWAKVSLIKGDKLDKEHVNYHYFSSDFFEHVLDESMTYSGALFNRSTRTLYEAQKHKIEVLMHKMEMGEQYEDGLSSGNILEMGCGWGYFTSSLHNRSAGAFNVTGVTISNEQYEYGNRNFGNANGDKKTPQSPYYYLMHYNQLMNVYPSEFFDAVVSVGTLSHIHITHLEEWFDTAYRLLKPGGKFVMQAVLGTQSLRVPLIDDFITLKSKACTGYNYVGRLFPGACPLHGDWVQEYATKAGFINMHREHIATSYGRTMHEWRMNLVRNKNKVMGKHLLDGDIQKYRMFEIYLANGEGAFRIGASDGGHFVFYKPKSLRKGKFIHTQKYTEFQYDIQTSMLSWPRDY